MSKAEFKDRKRASEAGRKGGLAKKGKKHKVTLLKDAIGVDRTDQILKNIERNIDEFIKSDNEKLRLDATKAFTDYYKPRRSISEIKFKGDITLKINPKIAKMKKSSRKHFEH